MTILNILAEMINADGQSITVSLTKVAGDLTLVVTPDLGPVSPKATDEEASLHAALCVPFRVSAGSAYGVESLMAQRLAACSGLRQEIAPELAAMQVARSSVSKQAQEVSSTDATVAPALAPEQPAEPVTSANLFDEAQPAQF